MNYKLIATFISLFPECIDSYINTSILGRAIKNKKIKIRKYQIRDFAFDKHKTVDDYPYGGGAGQLLKVDIVSQAINAAKINNIKEKIILLSPRGKLFKQIDAENLSNYNHIIFVCGRYEGIDFRIEKYVNKIYSIGDYILTGGELPAMVMLDAISRQINGVLGNNNSKKNESFEKKLLEYNQYTRPIEFEGHKVPSVLLSGNHKKIYQMRKKEQIDLTKKNRPDLLK